MPKSFWLETQKCNKYCGSGHESTSVTLLSRLPGQRVGMSVIRLIWRDNQREGQVCSPPPLGSLSAPRADSGIIYLLPLPFPASPHHRGLTTQASSQSQARSLHLQLAPGSSGSFTGDPSVMGVCWNVARAASSLPKPVWVGHELVKQKFRLLPKDAAMALCLSLLICKIERLTAYTSESATLYSENYHRKMWGMESAFSRNSPHTNSDYFYSYF